MPARALVAALAMLALGLAGCAEEPAAQDPGQELLAGPGTGAIRGVVVDDGIRPLANVTIRLGGTERDATTDAAGVFTFSDVAPGTYFLQASSPRIEPTQTSVEVAAGEVAAARLVAAVRFVIEPFHQTQTNQGFIQAAVPLATFIVDITQEELLGQESTLCQCTFNFTAGADVVAMTVEAVWEDTFAHPSGPTDLYLEVYPTNDVDLDSIKGGFLTNPIHQYFDRNATWGEKGSDGLFTVRLSGSSEWVNYQQPYQLFVTLWHIAPPEDEGWSFVAGDR